MSAIRRQLMTGDNATHFSDKGMGLPSTSDVFVKRLSQLVSQILHQLLNIYHKRQASPKPPALPKASMRPSSLFVF